VAEKVLGTGGRVQLIVFFGAIREILKREIYRGENKALLAMKTKGEFLLCDGHQWRVANLEDSVCE
jgi:hypothetical protein